MLEIFPERVLDNSIHMAIWVGLLVAWVFTERLGWVFAGFVVPGYLAALAIVHPMSFVATTIEGVLTWAAVWLLGAGAAQAGIWGSVFGRERFLLFILFSVPVRLVVEGLAAPQLQTLLRPLADNPEWAGGQFFSIGVVLVPLLANALWKPGLAVGLAQLGTTTGLTWALLSLLVIPSTNYELTRFELSFEVIALDFLYVPKTYIILLATALVAAWNNVRFGWDFNGILVPSLLALIVLTPGRLALTLAEMVVLVAAYSLLLRVPALGRLNLEGPRQLVAMYTLSFGLKGAVALVTERWWPVVDLSDGMGFGYLLTSLVAVKCFQKKRILTTLTAVGVTTVQGFALGTAVALALDLARTPSFADAPGAAPPVQVEGAPQAVLLAGARVRTGRPPPNDRLAGTLARAARTLLDDPRAASRSVGSWRAAGGAWAPLDDPEGCAALWWPRSDPSSPRGLPTPVACGGEGPALLVPRPASDPDSLLAAARLVRGGGFSGVLVAGLEPDSPRDLARELAKLRRMLGTRTVLWVRSGPEARYEPRTRRGTEVPAAVRATLPQVALEYRGETADRRETWRAMTALDAVITVPRAVDERPVASSGPTSGTATEIGHAWGALLRHLVREGPDAGAATHASLLGGRLVVEEGSWRLEETPHGVWQGRRSPGHWVVAAPEAAEHPGLEGFAGHLGDRLQARVVWTGEGVESGPDLQPVDLPLLEAIRAVGRSARLVVVRPQPPVLDPLADVMWSSGFERPLGKGPPEAPGWKRLVGALRGWSQARASWEETRVLYDRDLWAVRYQATLAPDRLAVLHVAPARLEQVDGHPDKEAAVAWARWRGVDVRPAAAPVDGEGVAPDRVRELVAQVERTWSDAALRALQASARAVLVDHGARLEWRAEGPGWTCSAVACGEAR